MLDNPSSHAEHHGAFRVDCSCPRHDALDCARAKDTDGDTDDPCECFCHLSSDPYIEDDHSAIKCDPRHFGPAKG